MARNRVFPGITLRFAIRIDHMIAHLDLSRYLLLHQSLQPPP